jgi:hypothetical protein
MKLKWLLAGSAAVLIFQIPWNAQAFECPKHFAEAQALIDKIEGDMAPGEDARAAVGDMPKEQIALVHSLLDDAKMFLAGAKHNHEKPQGAYDHARAIAKADAALGYARAADILHFKMLEK